MAFSPESGFGKKSADDSDERKLESHEADVEQIVRLSESRDSVGWRIDVVRYAYADYILRREASDASEAVFSDLILEYTDESINLRRSWEKISESEGDQNPYTSFDAYAIAFKEGLDDSYEDGGLEAALRFTVDFFESYRTELRFGFSEKNRRAGLIEYGLVELDSEGKQFLQIHFPPPEKHMNGENEVRYSYKESLRLLSRQIIESKKFFDYLRRETWMADMRKSVDYGFEKERSYPFNPRDGLRTWGQFLTADGRLKREEIRYLLEHEEPRYRVTEARMDFVEFLRRYAPEEYRGQEIEFLKMNESVSKAWKEFDDMKNRFEDIYYRRNFEGIISWLRKNAIWEYLMSSEIGSMIAERLREAKDKKTSFEELAESGGLIRLEDRAKELIELFMDAQEYEKVKIRIPENFDEK